MLELMTQYSVSLGRDSWSPEQGDRNPYEQLLVEDRQSEDLPWRGQLLSVSGFPKGPIGLKVLSNCTLDISASVWVEHRWGFSLGFMRRLEEKPLTMGLYLDVR